MQQLDALNGYGVRLSTLYATLPQWQLPRISKSSLLDSSPAEAAAAGEVEAMVVEQVVKWVCAVSLRARLCRQRAHHQFLHV